MTKRLALAILLLCTRVPAQVDKEPVAVVEIGADAERNLKGGASLGPTAAVEVTPIENWLELEAGVTTLFRSHSREWSTDLIFKKPWTLSRKVEFMAGAGPTWSHIREGAERTQAWGVEALLDFMFWPGKRRRFGWYLEPAYDHSFGRGSESSIGISGGLLIAIP